MELSDEILSEGLFFKTSIFSHHLFPRLAGFHIYKVLQIALPDNLTEKKQQFCLPVSQSIPFNMIAVEVVVNRKALT